MIAIGSVRHTGRRFMLELLRIKSGGAHFGEKNLHEKLEGMYVITPLRRLDSIIQSWSRRDLNLKELHDAIGIMIDYPSDYYLPIDHAHRERYLTELSDILGMELNTEWSPVGNEQKSGIEGPLHPEYAEIIRKDYSEWFDQFYG